MTEKEAVEILNREFMNYNSDVWDLFPEVKEALNIAISALSVPERKKGEWIAYDHGMGLVYLKCPFCGVTIDKRHVEHNFCGKCGAKLSGEKSGFEEVSE